MSHFIVTGGQGGQTQGAAAPNRREINDLIQDPVQFSLYIQALTIMFKDSQSDIISHFGIGGIHGLPFKEWDDAGGNNPVSGSQWGGYCTHGSMLFPTWHRPYVALYEQVMQRHALDIAGRYQVDKDTWNTAAQNLRAPYWDWATNSLPPAEVISLQSVNIITFDGSTISVPNPLFQYTFHPIDPSFRAPYSQWPMTLRHADSTSPNATTDVQSLTDTLESSQGDITSSTYNLLTQVHTWPEFSNHTPGDGGTSNSLEAIHDGIHVDVGGRGHMSNTAVAGFDPIFFLHHANVDRMLSLWAALNPRVWVASGPAEGGSWTIPGNATIGPNTDLTPFWNTQSGFWHSSGTTKTEALQYTYPEFNNLKPNEVQQAIANYVEQQYGGGGAQFFSRGPDELRQPLAASAVKPVADAVRNPSASQGSHPRTAESGGPGRGGPSVVHDWTVRIHVKKYELRESFTVLIFVGPVPDDPSHWRKASSYVGSHAAFVNGSADQCANCVAQADVLTEGFVHLNRALGRCSSLSSYEPQVVSPYLRENLHWRVQAVDRSAISLDRVPSLEVTVASTTLTRPPGSIFPVPGEHHYHHHITHGRQGGARHAQA
ncbi:photo-regulated tyrosinase [Lactifluus volemus]|nr:photo-regulated tyrosinase [Lactifluus volemus]